LELLGKESDQWKVKVYDIENKKDETNLLIDPVKKMASSIEQVVPAMGNAVIKTTLK